MYKLPNLITSSNDFAFDSTTGTSYSLNSAGKEVIELLNKGQGISQITDYLISKYELDKQETHIEVVEFITKLKIYGLTVQS
ncbi:MAG: PqqD family protein [Halobacteriovoraceae bacterium]|nr:PqqD family protein [Halobacteriovoraceae bacterium]